MPADTLTELLSYPEQLARRLELDAADGLAHLKTARRSSFPKIEGLLNSSEYQRILWKYADREALARHTGDRLSFLFHALCPDEGRRVLSRGSDALPCDVLSREEVHRCQHAMFCAMLVAAALDQRSDDPGAIHVSWNSIVNFAKQLASQTLALVPAAPLQ
ncbi:MAG TPA: hypothetical protein VJ694_04320 [Patescibacteria group bacterium]|nr:hypothetical protein [Patescibacteria group bacterium]